MEFFRRLKEVFEKIPIKTRFLKDLGFNNSYSGFRYFMQDRKETPSRKFLDELCEKMGYEYLVIPVKKDDETKELYDKLQEKFFNDLTEYLKQYENDEPRIYSKDYGKESTVATAIEAFKEKEEDPSGPKIDISDLF